MQSLVVKFLSVACLVVPAATSPVYPVIQAHVDTHLELGHAIGRAAGDRVRGWLKAYASLHETLLPFIATPDGAKAFASLKAANCDAFPAYCDEMRGLAAELGDVSFDTLMTMCLRHEVNALAKAANTSVELSRECTDILIPGAFSHNEDGDVALKDFAFFVNASVTDDGTAYFAFHYPVSLAGHAFAFNGRGLAMSMNAISPRAVETSGLAIYFLTRSCLDAHSIDDAIARLAVPNGAYGGNVNLGWTGQKRVVSVEVGPAGATDIRTAENEDEPVFHMNEYLRISSVPFWPNPSSQHRLARAEAIVAGGSVVRREDPQSFLRILGDAEDTSYPIFRKSTAATASFDLLADPPTLTVRERGNPLDNSTWVSTFLMRDSPHSAFAV